MEESRSHSHYHEDFPGPEILRRTKEKLAGEAISEDVRVYHLKKSFCHLRHINGAAAP